MALVIKKVFANGKHNFQTNDKIISRTQKKRPKGASFKTNNNFNSSAGRDQSLSTSEFYLRKPQNLAE